MKILDRPVFELRTKLQVVHNKPIIQCPIHVCIISNHTLPMPEKKETKHQHSLYNIQEAFFLIVVRQLLFARQNNILAFSIFLLVLYLLSCLPNVTQHEVVSKL
jgi:hypothetical protein